MPKSKWEIENKVGASLQQILYFLLSSMKINNFKNASGSWMTWWSHKSIVECMHIKNNVHAKKWELA